MFEGLAYFWRGFSILNQSGLRRYVIVPVVINALLFAIAIWIAIHYFEWAMNQFLPSWLSWLQFLLWPLIALGFLISVFFSFSILANLIAAPFYGRLAQQVEQRLRGGPVVTDTGRTAIAELLFAMQLEARKIGYYLVRAMPLLLLSLIPGLNLVAFPLWMIFSAWFMAYDAAVYSLENHHLPFDQQLQSLRSQRWTMLQYGGLNLCLIAIPVINLISPAAAVAGMTALLYDKGALPGQSVSGGSGSAISTAAD